ncbi:DNA polymerase III subunit epsilon [Lacibacterium aquatile]|uniref:DNA polymerase III subunit epsilon n=1 Tax=Lacibacterium aquatile TaxID=1168082 RepID=A0ABW5DZW5_9PROT
MREIVLDTETTGFDPNAGHRLVELACIELINGVPSKRPPLHRYVNPKREVPEDAFRVHGLSTEFLANHPPFEQIVDEFLEFIGEDSRLVIHNADFDMRFLNAELKWASKPLIAMDRAHCTMIMARKKFPGAPASLDALCKRFGIDNSHRTYHGALLDTELLADVYIELTGGRQAGFNLAANAASAAAAASAASGAITVERTFRPARPHAASEAEAAAHAEFLKKLKNPIWLAE